MFSQSLRNKVSNLEEADKPAAAATVSDNIFGVGGTFFKRKQRAASFKQPPKPVDDLPSVSIVPIPPSESGRSLEALPVSSISAVYQVEPRLLNSVAASDAEYVAPSTSAAPAFLRRQRGSKKEEAA